MSGPRALGRVLLRSDHRTSPGPLFPGPALKRAHKTQNTSRITPSDTRVMRKYVDYV